MTRLLVVDERTTLIPEAVAGFRWLPSRPPTYEGDPNITWAVQALAGGAWVVVAEFCSGHFGPNSEWVDAEQKASELANRLLDRYDQPVPDPDVSEIPRPGKPTVDLMEGDPLETESLFDVHDGIGRLVRRIRGR